MMNNVRFLRVTATFLSPSLHEGVSLSIDYTRQCIENSTVAGYVVWSLETSGFEYEHWEGV